jgi:transposase
MLRKETVIVLRHYEQEGLSTAAIAKKLGISQRTVQRYRKSGKIEPSYGPRPAVATKLDPYRDYLQRRLATYPELSAVRLLSEIRALGYAGGYTAVKDYVRTQRPAAPLRFEQRFEVEPGAQAQVDFATFKPAFGTVQALLVVLSWSRALWVRFGFQQDQLTVLGGLHRAFHAFGGVPRTLLFDRMRTAVSGAEADGSAIFNAELLRFATHYGFQPVACRPYRAQTKGRVERAVSYLRSSFFYARSFQDLADLNAQCEVWLANTANVRQHGTTGQTPTERLALERAQLGPLPTSAYLPQLTFGRRVSRDGFVAYNGNDYSVPDGLASREIQVRASLTHLYLLQEDRVIAVHPLLEGRGERCLDPQHQRRVGTPARTPALPPAGDPWELIEVERRALDVYEQVLG